MKSLNDIRALLARAHEEDLRGERDSCVADLAELKKQAVSEGNEPLAKSIWALQQAVHIHCDYRRTHALLREGEFFEAWCVLERVEVALKELHPHQDSLGADYALPFIKRIVDQMQSLYPYKLFTSPEMAIRSELCSICLERISIRTSCGHVVGEVYGGEYCRRIVQDFEPLGMAFVSSPVQKFSVPFPVNSKTGESEDHYDYSLISYLIRRLPEPFADWSYEWTTRRHPHEKFKSFGPNQPCPCRSGKKYKKCCRPHKEGVLMPHIEYIFSWLPDDVSRETEYTYDQHRPASPGIRHKFKK